MFTVFAFMLTFAAQIIVGACDALVANAAYHILAHIARNTVVFSIVGKLRILFTILGSLTECRPCILENRCDQYKTSGISDAQ